MSSLFWVELRFPGMQVVHPDRAVVNRVRELFVYLEGAVAQAMLACSRFYDAHAAMAQRDDVDWRADEALKEEVRQTFARENGLDVNALPRVELGLAYARARFQRTGRLPDALRLAASFLYSDACVTAMDRAVLLVKALAELPGVPPQMRAVYDDLRTNLPDLKGLRDAVAHYDERVQHKAKKKPLPTQGVAYTLSNDVFHATSADGTVGKIQLGNAMETLADGVQKAIDAFVWEGPGRPFPWYYGDF